MSFGTSLIRIREARNISRKDFAEQLGIPYTTLRNYETDQREPGHKMLIKMATLLSVSVDELVEHQVEIKKAPSLSDEAIVEQITERYGGAAGEALSMYVRLDDSDRGEIRGEMRQMLKAEKYSHSEPRMA